MSETISFPFAQGTASGYLALPTTTAPTPAIVVIQEYWGINDQMKDVAQAWAREGFVALVPDLYHGKLAADAEEARALMGALDRPRAIAEIAGAVELLRHHPRSTGKVAVSGYCLGGALSLATACMVKGLAAVVPFYGLPGEMPWQQVDAPIQMHVATKDAWVTVAGATAVKTAVESHGGSVELYTYEAEHAFCNARRPEVYAPEAAALAWQRTVAFVRAHV
jgi:carboxymethylenebutenolidase